MRMFKAVSKGGIPIITVMAEDKESAKIEVMKELEKNPFRKIYIPMWELNDKMVIDVEKDDYRNLSFS